MVNSSNSGNNGGVGFVGLLTLLFIGLKLGKVISWSWWWVLSPLWIYASFIMFVFVVAFLILLTKR